MSGINNWVHERGSVTENDILALERAKRIERKHAKLGYRWIKINERLQAFVPCDKDGNPTDVGKEKIRLIKESQNIK